MNSKYNLRDKLMDEITGFCGIVLAISFYVNGNVKYGLAPQSLDDKGLPHEYVWMDECVLVPKVEKSMGIIRG